VAPVHDRESTET
jgi:hypothetical protein